MRLCAGDEAGAIGTPAFIIFVLRRAVQAGRNYIPAEEFEWIRVAASRVEAPSGELRAKPIFDMLNIDFFEHATREPSNKLFA
jgi:hypothetical protein